MKKIYIVIGSDGEYGHRNRRLVKAFDDKSKAETHAHLANTEASKVDKYKRFGDGYVDVELTDPVLIRTYPKKIHHYGYEYALKGEKAGKWKILHPDPVAVNIYDPNEEMGKNTEYHVEDVELEEPETQSECQVKEEAMPKKPKKPKK
ncbi:MAG: hypothetical protein MUO24_02190 [Desulfobacterales bacterium]|nr:hypothetical protein [Desulfobacterales bacterium]